MLKLHCYGVRRLSLLLNLRHLCLSSSCPEAEATHSFINYLVDSVGFSKQEAASFSDRLAQFRKTRGVKKVSNSDSIQKAHSIVSFFKQHGFDQSDIRNVVCFSPRILRSNAEKTLKPKFDYLRGLGLSETDIVQIFVLNPKMLLRSLSSNILPAVRRLKEVLGDDEDVIRVLKRLTSISLGRVGINLVPNVALLRSYGIPRELIRKRILTNPFPYLRYTKHFKDILIKVVKKLGISREAFSAFLNAVQLLACNSDENLECKYKVFQSFGWTESDILDIVRRCPYCLMLSEARIKKSLEFFMKELAYGPDILISNFALLSYSLEKRMFPRHKVLLALKERGLVREDYPVYRLASLTEPVFVKRFVLPFEEVHEIYAEYTGRPV